MKGLGINANIICFIVCGLGFLFTLQQVCALSTTDSDFVPVWKPLFGVNFNEMYEIKRTKTKAFLLRCFLFLVLLCLFSQVFLESKGLPLRNWVHSVLRSQHSTLFFQFQFFACILCVFMLLLFDLCDVVSGGSQHFCMTIPFFWRVTSNLFFSWRLYMG